MRKLILFLSLFITTYSQDTYYEQYPEYEYPDYTDYYENNDYYENEVSELDQALSNYMQYAPPYKTQNMRNFKTKKLPKLISSDGMLKNIDRSYWSLKFYSYPDVALFQNVDISFKGRVINMKTFDFQENIVSDLTYLLTPVKMYKPNEGIFGYTDENGQLQFMYMHLLLEYMLAVKLVTSYEEAELVREQSLTELGIFMLR